MKIQNIVSKVKNNEMSHSVLVNAALKPVGMIISLLYTPLLLKYLGNEKYGVWVTILSIINWINYFDVGIGNGLRNRLASEIANKKEDEANESISTAYSVMFGIVLVIFVVGVLIGSLLNWSSILNTDLELNKIMIITYSFLCLNFFLSLYKNGFYAVQKSEIVALTGIVVQLLNLAGVFCFLHFSNGENSLNNMSYLFGGTGVATSIFFSLVLWKNYRFLRPNLRRFNRNKLKEICSLGFKFFFIQIAALILFTTDSLIISRLFKPEFVTPYNTVYKAFGVVQSLFVAILAPYWSRFTVAKEQNDYDWMKRTIRNIRKICFFFSICIVVLIPFFPWISDVWLGKHLEYENGLILCMAIYYISYLYSSIYSTALNGIGDINLQLICSIVAAAMNIPLSIFFARTCGMGTTGVCLGTIISLIGGDIIYTIQMNRIIRKGLER